MSEPDSIRRWDDTTPASRAVVDQNVAMSREIVRQLVDVVSRHRSVSPHECEAWCIGRAGIELILSLDPQQLRLVVTALVSDRVGP